MARFDVYRLRGGAILLDVQSDFLSIRDTRVVIPLVLSAQFPPSGTLTPTVRLDGRPFTMVTHQILTLLTRRLGTPIANLAHHRDDITRALDVLFTGF